MKVYVVSIAAGVLVGIVYGLLHVRSPAPPLVALCGLLGNRRSSPRKSFGSWTET